MNISSKNGRKEENNNIDINNEQINIRTKEKKSEDRKINKQLTKYIKC